MIKHKKQFANAIAGWTIIVALIPLGAFVHKGFGYLFNFTSWALGIANLFVILSTTIALFCGVKMSEFYKVMTDHLVEQGGIDKIYAEREQKPFDLAYMYGIVVYLIFTGQVILTALWLIIIWGHTIINTALRAFDDEIIDGI
jgi:hypothetical protein